MMHIPGLNNFINGEEILILKKNKREIRQLIRLAFITSPLIGIYSIAPVIIFTVAVPGNHESIDFMNFGRIFLGIFFITVNVLLQWTVNLLLFYKLTLYPFFEKHKWFKIVLSYLSVFSLVIVLSTVRSTFNSPDIGVLRLYPFVASISNNTFILIIFALVTSRNKGVKLELEKAKLEVVHLTTQHEQLKHKIH
ncbi:MAG: hypothetical protein MI922_16420, partial [Bacteroidales bacterium]|nr:hypothetical protein [Bacteroidales bacterium]